MKIVMISILLAMLFSCACKYTYLGQITNIINVSAGGFGQNDSALLEIDGSKKIIYEYIRSAPRIGEYLYLKKCNYYGEGEEYYLTSQTKK